MKLQFIVLLGGLLLLVACGGPSREAQAPVVTELHPAETSAPPQSTATASPIFADKSKNRRLSVS